MAQDTTDDGARAALVTGAGRRIGAAIARVLARAGYAVMLHVHRSHTDAEQLAAEIAGAGGRAAVLPGDLADPEAVAGLVAAARAFGPLSLLVNNASEFNADDIESLERAQFDRTLAVNLTAPLFLAQAFAAQAPEGSSIGVRPPCVLSSRLPRLAWSGPEMVPEPSRSPGIRLQPLLL